MNFRDLVLLKILYAKKVILTKLGDFQQNYQIQNVMSNFQVLKVSKSSWLTFCRNLAIFEKNYHTKNSQLLKFSLIFIPYSDSAL